MSATDKSKVIRIKTVASKYNRASLPDWLNTLTDANLDKYFAEHPTSQYNPFTNGGGSGGSSPAGGGSGGASNDPPPDNDEDDDWTEHKLPLARRLTFNGWSKSAPTKEVKARRDKYAESQEDIDLDRVDILDVIKDLREDQAEDKQNRSDTNSPRRKRRLTSKIEKRADKLTKLKGHVSKLKDKSNKLKKRIRLLDKEIKKRK